jgi:vacuolar protein sorting-associated protein 13A/C|eukprot:COSAG01_NODE_4963_length_4587_cov_1.435829_5_plen_59_part_00
MGKGLIGAVVKPAAGVLDLASDVSSGIMSSATMAGSNRASRTRPPRAAVHDPNDALVP